jgi:hypothetical protein
MYVYNNVAKRIGQTYIASLKKERRIKGRTAKTGDFSD